MKKGFRLVLFFGLLVWVLSSCNVFEETDGLPNLVVEVTPTTTAGSVLTSGAGSENGEVQLTAIANTNWRFSHWSGDVDSEENPLSLNLDRDTQVFANFVISGNEAGVKLTISDGQFISELRFGQIEGATDNFDSGLDLEAPPPPTSGVLYARFEGSDRGLIRDFRNPFTLEVEWEIWVVSGSVSTVSLIWEAEEDGSEIYTIFNESDEEIVSFAGSGSLDIDVNASSAFFIRN